MLAFPNENSRRGFEKVGGVVVTDFDVGAAAVDAKIKPAAQFEHYYFTIGAALSGLGACVVPFRQAGLSYTR